MVAGHKNDKVTQMAEDPEWVREKGLRLNYLYYFENCIKDALHKVFDAVDGVDFHRGASTTRASWTKRLGVRSGMLDAMVVPAKKKKKTARRRGGAGRRAGGGAQGASSS